MFDYHLHSFLSPDADPGQSFKNIAAQAQAMGMEEIAVTDHDEGNGDFCSIDMDRYDREWEKFGRTFYTQEHFTESIGFDKLEVELLTPDSEKKHSGPRTPLMDA